MKKLQLKEICLLFNLFYFYSEYIKVWNILDYLAGEIGVYFRFTAEAKDPVGFIVPNRTEEEQETKLFCVLRIICCEEFLIWMN